jgi:PPK2 family polyphosphate:nucleotide phosphotransferase
MAKQRKAGGTGSEPARVSDLLRATSATRLADVDPDSRPGFEHGDKVTGRAALTVLGDEISDLQERLYASGRGGDRRRVLLVVQGMDTAGKGGVLRHAVGLMDPQGVTIRAFKAPTRQERGHHFLWRIRNALPEPGMVGVFDRSHYEDVLVARVRRLAAPATVERRYATINRFERELVDDGCVVVKVILHISRDEQKQRLMARLDDPTKHWKYNPGDVDERLLWDQYRDAYDLVLARCSHEAAPFYVVPANSKWYKDWAVTVLLLEHLRAMDLGWPEADFDVAAERARVAAS